MGSERTSAGPAGSRGAAAWRRGDKRVPADEFDWIVLKRTEVHQSLVLDAFPPPQSEWRCRHGPNLAGPGTGVNINVSMSLGHHPHNRGASASRMASPTKFSPTTVTNRAAPGPKTIQGACCR